MYNPQTSDIQEQIREALSRAKWKKVYYIYDDCGYKNFLGVFGYKKANEIKKFLRKKNLINRLSEFEVRTTEPDTPINL